MNCKEGSIVFIRLDFVHCLTLTLFKPAHIKLLLLIFINLHMLIRCTFCHLHASALGPSCPKHVVCSTSTQVHIIRSPKSSYTVYVANGRGLLLQYNNNLFVLFSTKHRHLFRLPCQTFSDISTNIKWVGYCVPVVVLDRSPKHNIATWRKVREKEMESVSSFTYQCTCKGVRGIQPSSLELLETIVINFKH